MSIRNEPKLNRRLVKVRAAADYLAISERKLWDLSQNGIIPVIKLGRLVRYDLVDLDNFIEKFKSDIT